MDKRKEAFWIWYPGDFEIYHGMLQNFSREERGFRWPAYWYIDGCRKNLKFSRTYQLKVDCVFTVYANCFGYILKNGEKFHFGEEIFCKAGKTEIVIFAGSPDKLPAVLAVGEEIYTDESWLADDFVSEPVKAGCSSRYTGKEANPAEWKYDVEWVKPQTIREVQNGVLYDFGKELTAELLVEQRQKERTLLICYGESEAEALDIRWCYYSEEICTDTVSLCRRAFRYVFIPEVKIAEVQLIAKNLFVDIQTKASFYCDDELINKIWETAEHTFKLCSGIFFIDGIKRDRWIWSGDAYQSYFVNQYLMFDEDISKRTMWALRGNDPVRQHINTIVDYSMYWILGIYQHYQMTGDKVFAEAIYPKMKTMMEFLENQTDENGFIVGREGDWIFIDWADMDKDGAVCAEQMLLAMCYRTMALMEEILESKNMKYDKKYQITVKKIDEFFWDEEQAAYIDSFSSGKRHVSRHANIFAVLFGIANHTRAEKLCSSVLENPAVPEITTPYFKFYELEALCSLGKHKEVLDTIRAYWGGMLAFSADTFWEEYDPKKSLDQQYEMYGDPYGKSLCHAWAGSPVYLLGRYYMGLRPTKPGYESFELMPETDFFRKFTCELPVKDGSVFLKWDGSILKVMATRDGGTLKYKGKSVKLTAGEEVELG